VKTIATGSTRRPAVFLRLAAFVFPALLAFVWLSTAGVARGQSAQCAELERVRAQTYGFSPPKLSDAERKTKSDAMDAFWNQVKSAGPRGVGCLQEMLRGASADSFFSFDGSALLMSLDQSTVSMQVITKALERTDLADVQPVSYVRMSLALSLNGMDVGVLAEKYMRYPKVDDYVPEHAMKLDRTDGSLILYGSMDPQVAEKNLEKVAGEKGGVGRSAAVAALAMNSTEASFRAFHNGISLDGLSQEDLKGVNSILRYEISRSDARPKLSREAVLLRARSVIKGDFEHSDDKNPPYVAGDRDFESSARALLTPADLPLVYEARRKSVRGVSDESIDEYVSWTYTIVAIINRNDMYKELRPH
jgi:hypothetical protein